jgi:hypothetical protein
MKKYYPNLTFIGLSFLGIYVSVHGLCFFIPYVVDYIKQTKCFDLIFFTTLIYYAIPLSILTYIAFNSLLLFRHLYIIEIHTDNKVVFRHLLYVFKIIVDKADLLFRPKQKDSAYNDNITNFTYYRKGIFYDLNWLKGRLYMTSKDNRNITIYGFGYDRFDNIKHDLDINKLTNA